MKIAHLAQTYPPTMIGQAAVTQRLARGRMQHRHSVRVIAASRPGISHVEDEDNWRTVRLHMVTNWFRVIQRILRRS